MYDKSRIVPLKLNLRGFQITQLKNFFLGDSFCKQDLDD